LRCILVKKEGHSQFLDPLLINLFSLKARPARVLNEISLFLTVLPLPFGRFIFILGVCICRRLIIMGFLAAQIYFCLLLFKGLHGLCCRTLILQHLKRRTERRPEKYKKRLVFFWRVTSNENPSPITQWYDGPNYLSMRSFTILQAC